MDIRFLKKEEIKGIRALKVMKTFGSLCGLSDLAVILGAWQKKDKYASDGFRAGCIWLDSVAKRGGAIGSNPDSTVFSINPQTRILGVRPVLPSSETSKI